MVRRLFVGTLAAAALVGGSMTDRAQAQTSECRSYNASGACGEIRFNQAPDPTERPPAPQIAGMPSGQAASQAAPQAEAQPAAEE
jgi:hypothetical protein